MVIINNIHSNEKKARKIAGSAFGIKPKDYNSFSEVDGVVI
jgi:hypothetical protein